MSTKPSQSKSRREALARSATARGLSLSARDSSSEGPKPGYFIVRKSGEVVPLVAVDELPLGVDLVWVPRRGRGGFYRLVGLEEDEDGGGNMGGSGSDTAVSSPLLLPIRSSTSVVPASAQVKPQPPKSQSPGLLASIHAPTPSPSPANARFNPGLTAPRPGHQQAPQQACRHWCTHNRRCKWGENC
ncbi:hypothetical protein DSL72_003483 [Monilinia vaccinii-corymbosi]|uniref:C3H1-type domain-containing protein n=1 Tax=Monilinia vaccinii-corymbosi TaxID=61207 RepID=A0A8A3NZT7_9HELO|nr:hypothetical protein DSL72_003483 [Monilinia vaccinii-corymbosi]